MQLRSRHVLLLVLLGAVLILGGCTEAGLAPTADSTPTAESTPTADGSSTVASPTPSPQSDETATDGATPSPTPGSTADDGDSGDDPDGTLEVHVINVGQADAALLRTDEETMLIDSGDWRDDGATVIDYLEARDIDRIDHLVSTHAHADHIGGHEAVIDHFEEERDGIGAIYDSGVPHTTLTYERYLDAVERHDVDLFAVAEGDRIPFAGVEATVLNPEEPGGDDLHYNSVTVHLEFGGTSFLFTGDAELDAEARLVDAHGEALRADVYHAGHHGSNTSSSGPFLDAVDPQVAVISSAYDSQYGHPHDEPLVRFADRDVATTWTGVHGTVVFESDGREIAVSTQHDASTDPLEITEADEATAHPSDPGEERFVVEGRGGDDDSGADGRLASPVHETGAETTAVGVAT